MKRDRSRNIQAARLLRKSETPAEALLWKYLRDRHMIQLKFRRQFPIKGFVLDFYCPEKKLGVEIDGGIHEKQKEYDVERQDIIEDMGIKILRFTNNDIMKDIEAVLRKIKHGIYPSPLCGEGCPERSRGAG